MGKNQNKSFKHFRGDNNVEELLMAYIYVDNKKTSDNQETQGDGSVVSFLRKVLTFKPL